MSAKPLNLGCTKDGVRSSSFEELEVWKRLCALSVWIYELLKDCCDYSIRDQLIRSAISIPSNIAEGSERKSIPDFKRFISIAQGSAAEFRTQGYIARQVNIFSADESELLIQELKSISKMLQALHASLKNR